MPPNPNVNALRRNLAADALGRSVRNMGGVADASQRRNLLIASGVVLTTACAFTVGGTQVFGRMGSAANVCADTGAFLYVYAALFISRIWLSAILTFVLFLLWNARAEANAQSSAARWIMQVRLVSP
jgi:hypothetical protein